MKKEDFIKLGLTEELAEKCEKASKEELKGFVTKERFNEVNEEKKIAEEKVKGFEELNLGSEKLKEELETMKVENQKKDEIHQKELRELKLNAAIDKAITGKKGKNSTAIKALLNGENFKLEDADFNDDGTIKGLSDRLDELATSDEYLFDKEESGIQFKGTNPGQTNDDKPGSGKKLEDWSYDDFVKELEKE